MKELGVEEWRDVPGFEGKYKVSNFGRVLSTRREKILKGRLSGGPRSRAYLRVQVGDWDTYIHVLVLEAFVGPKPSDRHQGAHDDNNPKNNVVANLSWKTPEENAKDKVRHGTVCRTGRTGRPKVLDENKVREIRASTERQVDLAKRFGVAKETICHVIARRAWPSVQ